MHGELQKKEAKENDKERHRIEGRKLKENYEV